MNYQTYQPHQNLSAFVKFYWTLEVPYDPNHQKQKIIPDGCIEMTFNFKDKIKRYISDDEYLIQSNAMIMGQRTTSFFIEPIGDVDTFAVCFYPYGFTNFSDLPLHELVDTEIPIEEIVGENVGKQLEAAMINASSTQARIEIIERFLLERLQSPTTIENIVKETVDKMVAANGNNSIAQLLNEKGAQRRKLERDFRKQIGLSPKQLGKVMRLQTALNLLLNEPESLTNIAYESDYFDQSHFIKDFKEFIGITPKEFLGNENMKLSSLFYKL